MVQKCQNFGLHTEYEESLCLHNKASCLIYLGRKKATKVSVGCRHFNRLFTLFDIYVQRLGAFSKRQEQELVEFRVEMAAVLAE